MARSNAKVVVEETVVEEAVVMVDEMVAIKQIALEAIKE